MSSKNMKMLMVHCSVIGAPPRCEAGTKEIELQCDRPFLVPIPSGGMQN